jgi:hypothetical protein
LHQLGWAPVRRCGLRRPISPDIRASHDLRPRRRCSCSIGDDADNTCLDIRQGTERAVIIKHVQGRFARDTTPSAKTAAGILTLIRAKACPED